MSLSIAPKKNAINISRFFRLLSDSASLLLVLSLLANFLLILPERGAQAAAKRPVRESGSAVTKRSAPAAEGANSATTGNARNSRSESSEKLKVKAAESYGRLPLAFEENRGQSDSQVKFLSRTNGMNLFLTGREAVFSLSDASEGKSKNHRKQSQQSVLRMSFTGANPDPQIEGEDALAGKTNYLIGSQSEGWRTDVATYAKVRYRNLYPGIDMIYYGNGQKLEYDFNVAPNADPTRIRLAFKGAQKLRIDAHGDLVIKSKAGEVRQRKPIAYQETNGTRREIKVSYFLRGRYEVRFEIGNYDHSKPLVIDPALTYSGVFGGGGASRAQFFGVAMDTAGNSYITGYTNAQNFPTLNPLQTANGGLFDVVVLKLDPNGALVYSTYLGGSGNDQGLSVAVDKAGEAIITGNTNSPNFPTLNAAQQTYGGSGDGFVAKLSVSGGALVYSTYLGGSGIDQGIGVASDGNGNAYVTGWTNSTNFPTASPLQAQNGGGFDAFVTKISPSGAFVYSTYLGGSGDEDSNFANENLAQLGTSSEPSGGIAVDSAGNAYVTGFTLSRNFPTTSNAFQKTYGGGFSFGDAFVSKINPAGSVLLYSTYLGGNGDDQGFAVAADDQGNAYVTGNTTSSNFPTLNAAQSDIGGVSGESIYGDAFVTKLNTNASGAASLVYSTYLGGNGDEAGFGIGIDSKGDAYVTGVTDSPDFPTKNPNQATGGGGITACDANSGCRVSNTGLKTSACNTFAADPSNANTIFAGCKNGVYKSADGGTTWQQSKLLNNISGVVVDPSNSNTVYASTTSSGVFKSANGGVNFTQMNSGLTSQRTHALVINPSSPQTLYVATESGVFKTTNGATSWTAADNGFDSNLYINTLVINPSNPNTLFAGTYFLNGGIYRTTDGAATWTNVTNNLSNFYPPAEIFINQLAFDQSDPSKLYAAIAPNQSGDAGGLFRSADGGATWTSLFRAGPEQRKPPVNGYDLPSIDVFGSNILVGTSIFGALQSADGGASFQTFSSPKARIRSLKKTAKATFIATGNGTRPLGAGDAFFTALAPNGSITSSTFFGGTGADAGRGIATDFSNDRVRLVFVGLKSSNDFPATFFSVASGASSAQESDDNAFNRFEGFVTTFDVAKNCPAIGISPYGAFGSKNVNVGQVQVPGGVIANGGAPPYTFSSSGTLPDGTSLIPLPINAATLEGILTKAGTFTITITATDANGCKGSKEFTIKVVTECPTIDVSPFSGPGKDLTVGKPANLAGSIGDIVVQGGTGPYTLSVTSGALPDGTKLNQVTGESIYFLEGTPTKEGTFTFTVTVTDANGCKGSKVFTIKVNPQIIDINKFLPSAGKEGDNVVINLNGTIANGDIKSVDFNGTNANFNLRQNPQTPPAHSIESNDGAPPPAHTLANTDILTSVPKGATTGAIHVVLTSGTLTSSVPFYVTTTANAIDDPTFFVVEHYRDFLNREPDTAGLNFWVGQITSCNGDAACIDIKRQNVSAAYFLSREFQETGFFVIKMQRAAFGKVSNNAAKRISYLQFLQDSQLVGQGFIDLQPGADQILEQNKTLYAQAVAGSNDFISKYPNALSASQFVDALYQTAGVQPSTQERQDAINAFGSGDTAGRAAALRKVAESASVKTAEFRFSFVLLQYFGYLRRNPTDPPDNNDAGYQFWLNKLNQFGGDYIRSEMVRSFIVSTEYRKRFGIQ